MSKQKLFIHIGMHKTGSSSLQYILRHSNTLPIQYALTHQKSISHNFVAHWLVNDRKSLRQYIDQLEKKKFKSDFPLLISAESLSMMSYFFKELKNAKNFLVMEHFYISTLAECLRNFDVQVLVTLREFSEWEISIWKELVKEGSTSLDLETWRRDVSAVLISYPKVLEIWKKYFPIEIFQYRQNGSHMDEIVTAITKENIHLESKRKNLTACDYLTEKFLERNRDFVLGTKSRLYVKSIIATNLNKFNKYVEKIERDGNKCLCAGGSINCQEVDFDTLFQKLNQRLRLARMYIGSTIRKLN